MIQVKSIRRYWIILLPIIIGLGMALILPGLAKAQRGENLPLATSIHNAPTVGIRHYVSKSGDNSAGSDWSSAFTSLITALDSASYGDEIWVAQGIYTAGITVTNSFTMVPGVSVYGGFDGTELSLDERNWFSNPTVLSGDIAGDDTTLGNGVITTTDNISGTNSNHVLFGDVSIGTNITSTTVWDGFIITGGQADAAVTDDGGGYHCDASLVNSECSPTLANLTFSGNFASDDGGAIYNVSSASGSKANPTLEKIAFVSNTALFGGGGAFYNWALPGGISKPEFTHTLFIENKAVNGGAIMNLESASSEVDMKVISAIFYKNNATSGGAINNTGSGTTDVAKMALTNVSLTGNSATNGGAMYSRYAIVTMKNDIIWGNSVSSGNGHQIHLSGGVFNISNTLGDGVWLLDGNHYYKDFAYTNFVNDLGGNIFSDPLYKDADNGNLRLQLGSPAIDKGDNSDVPAGLTIDLDANPRIDDGDGDGIYTVDMGALENNEFVYKVYLPIILR